MPNTTYTIVLSKGTHVISRDAARSVLSALEEDRPTVEIALDPFGGVAEDRRTIVAVRHIVALTENPRAASEPGPSVLAAARRRRSPRG